MLSAIFCFMIPVLHVLLIFFFLGFLYAAYSLCCSYSFLSYLVLPRLFSLLLSGLFCFFQILFVDYSTSKALMLFYVISCVLCLYFILFTDCCAMGLCHYFQSSLKCGCSTFYKYKNKILSSSRHGLKVSTCLLTRGKLPLESARTVAILLSGLMCAVLHAHSSSFRILHAFSQSAKTIQRLGFHLISHPVVPWKSMRTVAWLVLMGVGSQI